MSMKHTPGPWRVKGTRVYPSTGIDCICTMQVSNQPAWDDDARLIATAPELLAELRNLRRAYVSLLEGGRDRILELGGDCDPVSVMEASNPYLRSTDAVIAKATGGAA